ncbi:MAG: hypothetical protein JNK02_15195 [Planctomycetes bacterium]|nr:hypothetical protein [Planctomycetota bacterium]
MLRTCARPCAERVRAALGPALIAACWVASCAPGPTAVAPGSLTQSSAAPEVGRLALAAPASAEFVVRGTLPVPPGTFPRDDRLSPFAVRDAGGLLVPTQVEVVARHPDASDGASVVEVLARVRAPAQAAPGARIEYAVVSAPHQPPAFAAHPAVEEVLRPAARLRLTARDVFGHEYEALLRAPEIETRTLRDGTACREWRSVTTLTPLATVPGPQGTLPHLMGVHAIFRAWRGEPVVSLDLLLHNGHTGRDPATTAEDPVGPIYFESLDLWLPAGWSAWADAPDSAMGDPVATPASTRVPLVERLAGGRLHLFPIQAQTVRRLVLAHQADAAKAIDYARDQNLGFARRGTNAQGGALHSWWNPATAAYFPQRQVLPRLDHLSPGLIAAQLESRYAFVAAALRTGSAPGYPLLSPALGWAHPWGIQHGGMAGGDEIDLYAGVETLEAASNAGYRLLAMRHRMATDRQPVALYDEGGAPAEYTRWTATGPNGTYLQVWCFLTPILWAADPFGFTTAPRFQVDAVQAQGRAPLYEADLLAHQPIDLEHLVRYTAPAKALAWIGNDTLAKEALALHAALFRMSYNELPNSAWDHYIPTGLGADEHYVAAHPRQGFVFGRLEAWGLDAVTAWHALADEDWRLRARPWFRRVVDVVDVGQSACSGFVQATVYEQLFGGQYRARQSIEQAITEHALVGVQRSVLDGTDPARQAALRRVLRASFRAMATPPGWSTAHHAPWSKLAVGDLDASHPPFCGPPPADGTADGGDGWQCWCSLAYAYELEPVPLYLARAEELLGGAELLAGLQAQGLWNLGNRVALLALAQRLSASGP